MEDDDEIGGLRGPQRSTASTIGNNIRGVGSSAGGNAGGGSSGRAVAAQDVALSGVEVGTTEAGVVGAGAEEAEEADKFHAYTCNTETGRKMMSAFSFLYPALPTPYARAEKHSIGSTM